MADGILTPCNLARSWHWFRQVTAPCNVACSSGIMTVNSPSGSTCNVTRGSGMTCHNFSRWQHHAMWQVALAWHTIEFAQTSAIWEFYFWLVWFRPYHCSRHVILNQSAKFYQNRTTLGRKKLRHDPRWLISAILDFRGPIMGSLKSRCTTSYRSSIDTLALKCLVLRKSRFAFWRQTNKQTDKQMDSPVAWIRSRCREQRLNKCSAFICATSKIPPQA